MHNNTGVLKGKVTSESGKALEGISIRLEGTKLGSTTNTMGEFVIYTIPPNIYSVIVSGIGYHTWKQIVRIKDGEVHSTNIVLSEVTHTIDEVEVKANKADAPIQAENLATQLPLPVTVITRKTIEMMGSRRLDEILKEQTGLAVVNDVGSGSRAVGLQLQGFDAAYTMITIDGLPLIGRNSGSLDLSRITIANIERIEIVKGASSSLFGSEALAGVVNIVTRQASTQPQALAILRYGTYQTWDATVEGETPFAKHKGAISLSGNYYYTGGFNVNPYLSSGQTAPPYGSYTLQGRGKYRINDNYTVSCSGRYSLRTSTNRYMYGSEAFRDLLDEKDFNGFVSINRRLGSVPATESNIRLFYYLTRYSSEQDIRQERNQVTLQSAHFIQYLHRMEMQGSKHISSQLSLTGGIGGTVESLSNSTYKGTKDRFSYFGYSQGNYKPTSQINIIMGLRYDYFSQYGGRLNPTLGIEFKPSAIVALKASVGKGYKAPDFKEMYQVFTNVQVGYTVIGVEEFSKTIQELQQAGQVASIRPVAGKIRSLNAETSTSYNMGLTITPLSSLKTDVNLFYNNVKNLITTIQVGTRTNEQQIFSYINLAKAYTAGLEASSTWAPIKNLAFSAGYQLLYAMDRGVIDSIRAGSGLYGRIRNPQTGTTREAHVSDYMGMDNRSRHMFNIRVFYEYTPWAMTGSIRLNYRGRYGYSDANNNTYIDRYDTIVESTLIWNASIEKKFFQKHLSVQLTGTNLSNYTNMLMPGSPGRMLVGGISWRFFSTPNS
ncbi:TonB-dependent receptor [Xanthocytophaga agilis]|uniref:TonB-dependent receptor n=1 Tax=Xanthocytophaga agilis TaxID=3048010 RepID=A0AAE3RCH2_9BACT|nr:TonB-dependent receptor [Xanthocytophaga agilis]MDJ1505237.1 TonB-dependent receptor [Xanthocytophaga agilis]